MVAPKLQEEAVVRRNEELVYRRRKAEAARRILLQQSQRQVDEVLTVLVEMEREIRDAASEAAAACTPMAPEELSALEARLQQQPEALRKGEPRGPLPARIPSRCLRPWG